MQTCCGGLHDVGARLDVPGQIRFVTVCAVCGREQREIGRQAYHPSRRHPRAEDDGSGKERVRALAAPAAWRDGQSPRTPSPVSSARLTASAGGQAWASTRPDPEAP